jgi:hypothetical protein
MLQNNSNLINEIISLVTFNVSAEEAELSIGHLKYAAFNDKEKFKNNLNKLYEYNKEIAQTISIDRYHIELKELIKKLINENKKCQNEDFKKFHEELLKIPCTESEVLYEFFGVRMKSEQIKFGNFTIYNIRLNQQQLISKYPDFEKWNSIYNSGKQNILIGVKVKARESNKAIELADKLCERFENVFSYVLGDLTHNRRAGILNFRQWTGIQKLVCNINGMGVAIKNDIIIPLDLEHGIFKEVSQGNDKIWDIITTQNNEIEKRILTSVEWIGKAIQEVDKSKSLVQFVFAIEALLQPDKKELLSPSIVSQFSDWVAFIISDKKEERKKIAKHFKELYSKRSAIAHGAEKEVTIEDLTLARDITNLTIVKFLTQEPFKKMKTMEELRNYMIDLKFK